MAEVG